MVDDELRIVTRHFSGAIVPVADVSRSVAFYRDVFGFSVLPKAEPGSAPTSGEATADVSTTSAIAGWTPTILFDESEVTLRSTDGYFTLGLVTSEPELIGLIPRSRMRELSVRDPEVIRSAAIAYGALGSDEGHDLVVVDPDGMKWRIIAAID